MPIYEYRCEACGERFDKLFTSLRQVPPEITCPTCHSPNVHRLLSMPAIRKAGEGGSEAEVTAEPASGRPPVFGRKELNEALAQKKQFASSED